MLFALLIFAFWAAGGLYLRYHQVTPKDKACRIGLYISWVSLGATVLTFLFLCLGFLVTVIGFLIDGDISQNDLINMGIAACLLVFEVLSMTLGWGIHMLAEKHEQRQRDYFSTEYND